MTLEMVNQGHLGGYIAGGDPATFFPDMWRWVVKEFNIKSMFDLGCGEGHAMQFFRTLGVKVIGCDGLPQDDEDIVQVDFEAMGMNRRGDTWVPPPVDLVWSSEFLEHVEATKSQFFVPAINMGKLLLITHAFPGQLGHHHVNCQPPEYWKGFFAAAGWSFDPGLTEVTKSLSRLNKDPNNHYLRAGMAFRKVP